MTIDQTLGDAARRALSHIVGRTRRGDFANCLWDMRRSEWGAARDELRQAGYQIYRVSDTVADDPTGTGGCRFDLTTAGQPRRPLAQSRGAPGAIRKRERGTAARARRPPAMPVCGRDAGWER
jgi:hypothetical protein